MTFLVWIIKADSSTPRTEQMTDFLSSLCLLALNIKATATQHGLTTSMRMRTMSTSQCVARTPLLDSALESHLPSLSKETYLMLSPLGEFMIRNRDRFISVKLKNGNILNISYNLESLKFTLLDFISLIIFFLKRIQNWQ